MQAKCCNCGGQHNVTYGGCKVRKRVVEIQIQVKTVNNISYADAVKTAQGQKGMEETDKINQSSRSGGGIGQANMTTELDVDKLILFVAYVVNCTDQVKHKNEDNCERS